MQEFSKHCRHRLLIIFILGSLIGCDNRTAKAPALPDDKATVKKAPVELLNVSYDVTRELYRDVNQAFVPQYEQETGTKVTLKQSHAGSSSQARSVIDGLNADVVTLNMWPDIDNIRQKGLIKANWEEQFPHRSLPYFSTIVFVVRKGNPKQIHDWPDLIREGVEVVTPSPKTSGNGKLSFLAAWGSVISAGGTKEAARDFITQLHAHMPVRDSGGRAATITFSQKGIGDVHLPFENEAHLEVAEAKGELEIVYPPTSIRAEPHVAIVDTNVDRKHTRQVAEAYLNFLFTPQAQEIFVKHFLRPSDAAVLEKHAAEFPKIKLFSVTEIAQDWGAAQQEFFADGALFDQIDEASATQMK